MIHRFLLAAKPINLLHHGLFHIAAVLAISVISCTLTAPDVAAGATFGTGISLSGDTLLVGAPYADSSDVHRTGKAYVFVRSGTTWNKQAELVASDRADGDFFGGSVKISGNVAIIGAETFSSIPNTATGIDPITLRATISNLGPSSADQVTAYVGLPSGATLKSYNATGWSCVVTAKSLTCLRSSLARGSASSLLAVVIPPHAKKQFVLSGEVENEVFDPVLSNNSVQLTVINTAPIP